MEKQPRHHTIGVIYFLFSWLLFTIMNLIVRYPSQKIPMSMILFVQNGICLLSMIPWLKSHGIALLKTERFGLLFFRSICSLISILLAFLAVKKISLIDTMLLVTASPLWIPFVELIWRKIPLNHWLWPGLVGGFVGIIMILHPDKNILQGGAVLALLAGIISSINMISIRILSHTERNHTVMFYYFLIATLVTLPISLYQWVTPTALEWLAMVAVGVLFLVNQWTVVLAFHHAKPSHLGPFCYSTVVYSVLLEWAIFHQVPSWQAWIGIVLVCLGGLWAMRFRTAKV